MEPSAAAAAARFKLISVASFGLITGACALIGYYLARRYRRSSDLNSAGCLSDERTPTEKLDTGESKNAEVVSDETSNESRENKEHEATIDSTVLHPENRAIDTNQDSVAEPKKLNGVSVTGIDSDIIDSSSHTSNATAAKCEGVESAAIENGNTSPGKREVFSAGVTHFLDETNGDLLPSGFANGTQQPEKQDTRSETVIVGGGKEGSSAKESGILSCQPQVNGLNADRNEEVIEAKEERKLKADVQEKPQKVALNQKAKSLSSNEVNISNLGTNVRKNGEGKISEVENFSGDQISPKPGKGLKSGAAAVASAQESTSRDANTDHGDRPQQLAALRSALPLPLTPPPDGGTSRRQRGRRGGHQSAPATSKQTRGRRRWSPLEEGNAVAGNVELDAGSQQASWSSSRASGGAQSDASSPWTVDARGTDGAIARGDPAGKVEFDDNFVVDNGPGEAGLSSSSTPKRPSQQREVPRVSGPAKDIGSLVQAAPECVLERKPLIGEDEEEEEEEDDEDEDGHLLADHQRKKTVQGEEETKENVCTDHEMSTSTTEGRKKLVHIDENCVDSLIQLLAREATAEDTAVRLASLRALVNLSWTTEKHGAYSPAIDRLFAIVDSQDARLRLESLRVLANLSKNPEMVPYLLAAKAPGCLLKMLTPDLDDEVLTLWLGVLDDVLWTSKELCLTYASLPSDRRAASPETVYTGLYGLKNSRVLKSRIFILSRHRSQQVTYLASHIYSCLTS